MHEANLSSLLSDDVSEGVWMAMSISLIVEPRAGREMYPVLKEEAA